METLREAPSTVGDSDQRQQATQHMKINGMKSDLPGPPQSSSQVHAN